MPFLYLRLHICINTRMNEGNIEETEAYSEREVSPDYVHAVGYISRPEEEIASDLPRRGFILRRYTMLYDIGLAASTNNCQLNVLPMDRSRYQLRENSRYHPIKMFADFEFSFVCSSMSSSIVW